MTQLSFQDIEVSVKQRQHMKQKERLILQSINGVFLPNHLSVILGSSGSGKSTLLNVISGNGAALSNAKVSGNVYVNQEELPQGRFVSQISGYVQQDDLMLSTMTVLEACFQSAKLRRSDLDDNQQKQLVNQVLSNLQLFEVRQSRIGGSEERGISGGQRKRLSIAMEIIADPPILFLDECTSGLDAKMALNVVQLLKQITLQSRTVITTLHQPSSQIMELADDLLILADGRVVYHGPAHFMQTYFESLGYQFPMQTNPADFLFIEVMEGNQQDQGTDEHRAWLADVYEQSQAAFQIHQLQFAGPQKGVTKNMVKKYASTWTQTKFLFGRLGRNLYRSKGSIFVRLLTTVGLATFIALVFLNLGRNTQQDALGIYRSLSGAVFLVLINQTFVSFNSVLTAFGQERALFEREYSAGYYGTMPYFLSKVLIELPFQLIFPVILSLTVYWIIGFRPGFEHFLVFTVFIVLTSLFGAALGLAVATLLKREELAIIIGPLFILPLVIFGGFFVTLSLVPIWLQWIQWISPIQYAFSGIVKDQLEGRVIQGVPGSQFLAEVGSSNNFSILVNSAFISVGIAFLIVLAYLGLLKSVKNSGIRRRDVQQKRRQVLQRK